MVRGKTVNLYINVPKQSIFLMYTVQALEVKVTMQDFDKLLYDKFDKNDLNLKTPFQTTKSTVSVTYEKI